MIELLIVVAVILIIAAIAIPNLIRARISANQSSAVASMRSISTAEIQYQSNYPLVGFSNSMIQLGTGAATNPPTACAPAGATSLAACLIDGVLTAASVFPKSGYFMSETGFVGPGGTNSSYVAEAGPVTFDRTGHHSYCIILDNIVRMDPTNAASGLPGTNPVACLAPPFTPIE